MAEFIKIGNINLHYQVCGEGHPLILLHGWGCDVNIFNLVQQDLENKFKVYTIDFPGFGQSDPPAEIWGIEDYTRCLEEFTTRLSITNPILLGHSFGGRVSILYGSRNAVKKIILVDAAGIKPKRTLKYYIKVYPYKWAKKLMPILIGHQTAQRYLDRYRQKVGSSDYKNLSGTMRGTFIKVVNEDLKKFMPSIQAPTLLIWGELDTATPLKDAKIMNKLIPDSGLVVLKGCGHYSFLDNYYDFIIILNNFLKEDQKQ